MRASRVGFFDRLFGRTTLDDDVDHDDVPLTAERVLATLVPLLGAKEVLCRRDDFDDLEVEVRGTLEGWPARIQLDDGPSLEIQLKAKLEGRALMLVRDMSQVPKVADADDPWDDGEVRTFVAKGIYAEGEQDYVEACLRLLGSLEPGTQQTLYQAMAGLSRGPGVIVLAVGGDQISLNSETPLDVAGGAATAAIKALAAVTTELMALPDPLGVSAGSPNDTTPPAEALVILRCDYCGSRFRSTLGFECPNCGAQHRD